MLSELRAKKLTKLFAMYNAHNRGALQLLDFELIVHKLAELRGWRTGQTEYDSLLSKVNTPIAGLQCAQKSSKESTKK